MLPTRLYTLSRTLVKLCRHTGTDRGFYPTQNGWLPVAQTLAVANHERAATCRASKSRGKGRGGGNAPAGDDYQDEYTIHEVIHIVNRATRPHFGLMESRDGRIINIRAWGVHAGLRLRGRSPTSTLSRSWCPRPVMRTHPGSPSRSVRGRSTRTPRSMGFGPTFLGATTGPCREEMTECAPAYA